MSLETEEYEGELRDLRKLKATIKHEVLAERLGNVFFICGQGGEKDLNDLPEEIHICPAYGVDWIQIYKRTDKIWGPEW